MLERYNLTSSLLTQGRIIEAELEARALVKDSVEMYGKASSYTGLSATLLGYVLLRQGKINDADLVMRTAIRNLKDADMPELSEIFLLVRGAHAAIMSCKDDMSEVQQLVQMYKSGIALESGLASFLRQGKINDVDLVARTAMRILKDAGTPEDSVIYISVRSALASIKAGKSDLGDIERLIKTYITGIGLENTLASNYFIQKEAVRNPLLMKLLLSTGMVPEASKYISNAYEHNKRLLGDDHYLTAEMAGFKGILNYKLKKNYEAAGADFKAAIPVLIANKNRTQDDYLRSHTFGYIFEAYLDFLRESHGNKMNKGLSASAELFRVVDILMGNSVSTAMAQSSARAAVKDKDLADLIRREQDILKHTRVLEETLINLGCIPTDEQVEKTINDLRGKIKTLYVSRKTIIDEIKNRFPKYTDFANPQLATLDSARANLHQGETLVIIYSAQDRSYIWAIPYKGEIAFHISQIGRSQIIEKVAGLRKALAPNAEKLGDVPAFDVASAYELYNKLLQPVAHTWKDAKSLLVVAHGPLGQLPLALLPTEATTLDKNEEILFGNYRKVPWLVRKVGVTMLPSISALANLRDFPEGDIARKAFVGFGDPIFSAYQLAQEEGEKRSKPQQLASRGIKFQMRGVRVTEKGNLDNKLINSISLESLNRLPDTSEEILSIANALNADPKQDVFLGKNASKHQVKSLNLSNRRVIAFATHALVPGDLDGLSQPALALSAPSVTGDEEDGLLTMGEIMTLKLNADWVVLSACNTGASEGEGSEALSGLVKAFFYAGTRSILASMWPVETNSAKMLVSDIFSNQKADKTLTRSLAFRNAMIELIKNGSLIDQETGKYVASYAHPLFWAPFIMIGDPGN